MINKYLKYKYKYLTLGKNNLFGGYNSNILLIFSDKSDSFTIPLLEENINTFSIKDFENEIIKQLKESISSQNILTKLGDKFKLYDPTRKKLLLSDFCLKDYLNTDDSETQFYILTYNDILSYIERIPYEYKLLSKDEDYKHDRDLALIAVTNYGPNLKYVDDKFLNDEDIVYKAVSNYGTIISIITQNKIDTGHSFDGKEKISVILNEKIILAAVQNDGMALEYVKDFLLEYPDDISNNIRLEAVKNDGMSLQFINKDFQNQEILSKAIESSYGRALCFIVYDSQTSDLIFESIKYDNKLIKYANKSIFKDKTRLKQAIKESHGKLLQFIDKDYQTYDLILEAMRYNGCMLQYAKDEFKNNEIILKEAIESSNGKALEFIHKDNQTYDLVRRAVQLDGCMLQYAKDEFKTNEVILKEAIKSSYGRALKFIHKNNQTDGLVRRAVQLDGSVIIYVRDDLKTDELKRISSISDI